jgi:hypothetical protein
MRDRAAFGRILNSMDEVQRFNHGMYRRVDEGLIAIVSMKGVDGSKRSIAENKKGYITDE